MTEAQSDPFVSTEHVEEDEQTLRLLDEDCRKIDEDRVRMLTPEQARAHFRQWLTSSPISPKR